MFETNLKLGRFALNLSLIITPLGICAIDENGGIYLNHNFPGDVKEIIEFHLDLRRGIKNPRLESFATELAGKIEADRASSCVLDVEDVYLHTLLIEYFGKNLRLVKESKGAVFFRNDIEGFIRKLGFSGGPSEFFDKNAAIIVGLTRNQIKIVAEQNDRLIIQAMNSIDDINKSINIFSERIREWYGLHFPELTDRLVSDHEFFLELITKIGYRSNFTADSVLEIRPLEVSRAEKIVKRARESMGGDFSIYDMKMLQEFAGAVLELYETSEKLKDYVESLMEQ
ncbi:MAG: hypothetical protein ACTSRA_15135, partial [Promethearchaeota archaeon]